MTILEKRKGPGRWLRRTGADLQTPAVEALLADVPIAAASRDRLARVTIAERIAQILSARGGSDGRVFAIRGAWGFDKSSLNNLIVEALAKRHPDVQLLDVNPWQWDDDDAIARVLSTQTSGTLGGAHGVDATKRAEALRHYRGLLMSGGGQLRKTGQNGAAITTMLTIAAGLAATLAFVWACLEAETVAWAVLFLAAAAWGLGSLFTWYGRDRMRDALDEVRGELVRLLKALKPEVRMFTSPTRAGWQGPVVLSDDRRRLVKASRWQAARVFA